MQQSEVEAKKVKEEIDKLNEQKHPLPHSGKLVLLDADGKTVLAIANLTGGAIFGK